MSPHKLHVAYELLSDAIAELDDIRQRLENIAELLLEVRNRGVGLDATPDAVRHQQLMGDDHGPD